MRPAEEVSLYVGMFLSGIRVRGGGWTGTGKKSKKHGRQREDNGTED
jgi:hypothetical protein